MPTKEEIDSSPYTEKLQRPAGSATSRDTLQRPAGSATSRDALQRPAGSASSRESHQQVRNQSARSRAKSGHSVKSKRNTPRTERDEVSRTLKKQLEEYFNKERREGQFSTNGIVTTTRRMEPFDVAYRLIEADHMERASPRNPKNRVKSNRKKTPGIDPHIEDNSRRVAQYNEIDRLVHHANAIYQSLPIDKLASIHRYRPHPREEGGTTQNGKVQGYHRHFGAALHAQSYVDFYSKTDLDSGKPSCRRLKKLPMRKPGDEEDSTSSSKHSAADKLDRRNNNK